MAKVLLTLSLLFTFFLMGCKDEQECPKPLPQKDYLILDTSGHWFEGITNNQTLLAYSNQGKTESYDIRFSRWLKGGANENCTTTTKEQRTITYPSSLYHYLFFFEIRRDGDFDYLRISNKYDFWQEFIEVKAQQPDSCIVSYTGFNTVWAQSTRMPVSKIDSITIKSRIFYDVFKIDLVESLYSFDRKTKTLYFNRRCGLIKFETFEGEVWSLY